MIGRNLIRHLSEFSRYVRNYKYERTETGLYFPVAHAHLRGAYTHWITGYESDVQTDVNVIPYEGQGYVLEAAITGDQTAISTWYVGLHSGTGAEAVTTTAATYDSAYSEIQATSGDPGGYSGANRTLWANDVVAGDSSSDRYVINDATPAAFTVSTTTTLLVNGAWMTDKAGKTDYTGLALSITKFTAQRSLADTDVFNLKYKLDLDHV